MNNNNFGDLEVLSDRDKESREYILYNATIEDYMEFISDQINDPFDASIDINYIKRIRKLIPDDNKMDKYCERILEKILERYENIELNLDNYNAHLLDITDVCYKFFIKNIRKLVTVFIKEYIMNAKNRKALVADYYTKLSSYPKEQYGNKDNYILITFLKKIVKSYTKDGELRLSDFIYYIKKSGDYPEYIDQLQEYIEDGYIVDYGVFRDISNIFWKSDVRDSMINKLSLKIIENIIKPDLDDMGNNVQLISIVAQDDDDDLQDLDKIGDPDEGDIEDEIVTEYDERDVNQ